VNSNGHPGAGTKSITTGKMDALLFQQVIKEVTQFVCNLARNSRGTTTESPTPWRLTTLSGGLDSSTKIFA
jgi:hypothetical protein